jgi:hypothetical protein
LLAVICANSVIRINSAGDASVRRRPFNTGFQTIRGLSHPPDVHYINETTGNFGKIREKYGNDNKKVAGVYLL